MVKISQTELLKLSFEIIPKSAFSGFYQKILQAMDEDEIFLPISKSLGSSGVRDGFYTSKL
jgi:hypothetical protein